MALLPDPLLLFYHGLVWLHISTGALALVLFWLPLGVTRGSRRHKQLGHWYIVVMYMICGSGAVMASLVLASPQYFKPDIFTDVADIAAVETAVRHFWFFLLFLCVLVFSNIRQALFALREKHGPRHSIPWRAMLWPALLLLFSLLLANTALQTRHILFAVFAVLGITNAIAMLRYLRLPDVTRNQQIVEHIGNICGSGIGVYTAFFAFGGRTLFDGLGQWQLTFWIIPGIIGTLLINRAVRPYKTPPQKTPRQQLQKG